MEQKLNILLVDDENEFLETTVKRLTRRGYSVKGALDCGAALTILEAKWPDVVVLDVMLPDRNGLEFLKEIKQKWPRMVVIFLSGHASMHAALEGMDSGANDYCLKPIELDDLVEKITIAYKERN